MATAEAVLPVGIEGFTTRHSSTPLSPALPVMLTAASQLEIVTPDVEDVNDTPFRLHVY